MSVMFFVWLRVCTHLTVHNFICQVSETYTLRNFVVKPVDEIYRTSLDGKFEIVLSTDLVMEAADEKIKIPFTPVPLDQIDECEPDKVIGKQLFQFIFQIDTILSLGVPNLRLQRIKSFPL